MAMADFRKALVVDDSKLARFTLTKILEKMGFEVSGVTSGEEALASVEQALPDLIFMDFQMPGIDGYEASARITAHRKIPIIICTAQEDYEQELARAKAHGAFDLLRKPVTENGVEGIMEKIRTHWQSPAAPASPKASAFSMETMTAFFQQEATFCQSQVQEALRGLLMEKISVYLAKELTPLIMQKLEVRFQEWLKTQGKS
jgi:CheY-like chemotaxis protein